MNPDLLEILNGYDVATNHRDGGQSYQAVAYSLGTPHTMFQVDGVGSTLDALHMLAAKIQAGLPDEVEAEPPQVFKLEQVELFKC